MPMNHWEAGWGGGSLGLVDLQRGGDRPGGGREVTLTSWGRARHPLDLLLTRRAAWAPASAPATHASRTAAGRPAEPYSGRDSRATFSLPSRPSMHAGVSSRRVVPGGDGRIRDPGDQAQECGGGQGRQ